MRRILGTIGVVAVAAVAGSAVAGLGDDTQVNRATVDLAQAPSASAELEVSDDGATLVAERLPEPTPTLPVPRGDGSATAPMPGGADDTEAVLVTSTFPRHSTLGLYMLSARL